MPQDPDQSTPCQPNENLIRFLAGVDRIARTTLDQFQRPGRRISTGLEVIMSLRGFRTVVVCALAAVCCALTLLSCNRSPMAPAGVLLVHVTENGVAPAPDKRIEIRGAPFSQSQSTDQNGEAVFLVHAGSYVVRAYELGTPGPSRPFVEQSVEVQSAQTSRAEFNDCTMCRSPGR